MIGQGDLGFIGSRNNAYMGSKTLMGGTGNPSKKGPFGPGALSRMNNSISITPETLQPEIASETMLAKRTEWLENQEKKLTASMSETKTNTSQLASQIAEDKKALKEMKELTQEMNNENKKQTQRAIQLYNETQWVYGKVGDNGLQGFTANNSGTKMLDKYRDKQDSVDMKKIGKKNENVLLLYPMEKADLSPTHFQYLMRCKTVNETTGQLTFHWVIVYELDGDKESRYIKKFLLENK